MLHNIFNIECLGDKIKINHIDNVNLDKTQFVPDSVIEMFDVDTKVAGVIYRCNITNNFLMSTKTLPVLYLNVVYQKMLKSFLVYSIQLNFTITQEINSVDDLLNKPLNGYFTMQMVIEDSKKDVEIKEQVTCDGFIAKLKNLALNSDMKSIVKASVTEINANLEKELKNGYIDIKPPTNYISLKNYKVD